MGNAPTGMATFIPGTTMTFSLEIGRTAGIKFAQPPECLQPVPGETTAENKISRLVFHKHVVYIQYIDYIVQVLLC